MLRAHTPDPTPSLPPTILTKTYIMGAQKNHLNETVLLSTQNKC